MIIDHIKKTCSINSIASVVILTITMLALVTSYTYLENTYSKIKIDVELISNKIDKAIVTKSKQTEEIETLNTPYIAEEISKIVNDLALLKESVYKLTVIYNDNPTHK